MHFLKPHKTTCLSIKEYPQQQHRSEFSIFIAHNKKAHTPLEKRTKHHQHKRTNSDTSSHLFSRTSHRPALSVRQRTADRPAERRISRRNRTKVRAGAGFIAAFLFRLAPCRPEERSHGRRAVGRLQAIRRRRWAHRVHGRLIAEESGAKGFLGW